MNIAGMTGLEVMQAFLVGKLPWPPMATTIPMRAQSVEHGRVVFIATANQTHANPLGGVHGGFAATVIDSITGCAAHTVLGLGEGYGTVDLNVKMCRPIPFDQALIAEGRVINTSKNLVVCEGFIRDEADKIYAYGSATCMITRSK